MFFFRVEVFAIPSEAVEIDVGMKENFVQPIEMKEYISKMIGLPIVELRIPFSMISSKSLSLTAAVIYTQEQKVHQVGQVVCTSTVKR